MTKSADAFRTISEVADWLDTETHVLRFWESKFSQIKPLKRAGGRRYYRPKDMLIIGGIKKLLHEDGITIKGTQRIIQDKGLSYISDLSRPLETVETEKTRIDEKISSKTTENQSVRSEEKKYSNTFDEVDVLAQRADSDGGRQRGLQRLLDLREEADVEGQHARREVLLQVLHRESQILQLADKAQRGDRVGTGGQQRAVDARPPSRVGGELLRRLDKRDPRVSHEARCQNRRRALLQ